MTDPGALSSWLLDTGGALGFLCVVLLAAVGVLWRDNVRMRNQNQELQEKRIAEQKVLLTELTRVLQGQEGQFREVLSEVRGHRRGR